jgi:hypothetical protein
MATSRACSSEGTALMTQGRNGRGHGMKPSPMGKTDRREVNPVFFAMAANQACLGEWIASFGQLQTA